MIEAALLLAVLAVCLALPAGVDCTKGRVRVGVTRLVLLGLLLALALSVVGQTPTTQQWLQCFREQATSVESCVAYGFSFSSSPQPGVVKQTMGSSRVLEAKQ